MRRKDLHTNTNLAPGVYLLQGDEGDPEALVVQGPFPDTIEGKRTAGILGEQLTARTRVPHSLVMILNLPAA